MHALEHLNFVQAKLTKIRRAIRPKRRAKWKKRDRIMSRVHSKSLFSAAFIIGFGVWADGQSGVKTIRFRIKSERNCCLFRVIISFVVC